MNYSCTASTFLCVFHGVWNDIRVSKWPNVPFFYEQLVYDSAYAYGSGQPSSTLLPQLRTVAVV